jgi:hypothetical protein
MAIIKKLNRRNGSSGEYVALRYFWVDDLGRSARAYFALYSSKQAARDNPDAPLIPIVAKVALRDAEFDKRLGAKSKNPRDVFYKAMSDGVGVIADEGPTFYEDGTPA